MIGDCGKCGHMQRFHGAGRGKCWAPNMRCTCMRYQVPPPEAPAELGADVHELPREDVLAAYRAGLLIPDRDLPPEVPPR